MFPLRWPLTGLLLLSAVACLVTIDSPEGLVERWSAYACFPFWYGTGLIGWVGVGAPFNWAVLFGITMGVDYMRWRSVRHLRRGEEVAS